MFVMFTCDTRDCSNKFDIYLRNGKRKKIEHECICGSVYEIDIEITKVSPTGEENLCEEVD